MTDETTRRLRRYSDLAKRYGPGPLPLLERCDLLATRLDAALVALEKLAIQASVCSLCGRRVKTWPCWHSYKGEHCLEPELHAGDHWCPWIGWRTAFTNGHMGLCGAGDASASCQLPKNHDGPHALPPVGHLDTCPLRRSP